MSSMNRRTLENSPRWWSIFPLSAYGEITSRGTRIPEPEGVHLRRCHVVVEAAVVVPRHEDGRALPHRALHDRVDHLRGPVLPQAEVVLRMLGDLVSRCDPRDGRQPIPADVGDHAVDGQDVIPPLRCVSDVADRGVRGPDVPELVRIGGVVGPVDLRVVQQVAFGLEVEAGLHLPFLALAVDDRHGLALRRVASERVAGTEGSGPARVVVGAARLRRDGVQVVRERRTLRGREEPICQDELLRPMPVVRKLGALELRVRPLVADGALVEPIHLPVVPRRAGADVAVRYVFGADAPVRPRGERPPDAVVEAERDAVGPGKVPKRLSKVRFSLIRNTTCLIGHSVPEPLWVGPGAGDEGAEDPVGDERATVVESAGREDPPSQLTARSMRAMTATAPRRPPRARCDNDIRGT